MRALPMRSGPHHAHAPRGRASTAAQFNPSLALVLQPLLVLRFADGLGLAARVKEVAVQRWIRSGFVLADAAVVVGIQ